MRNNLLQIAFLSLLLLIINGSHEGQFRASGRFRPAFRELPPYLQEDTRWADSITASLSLEEQIAQMIMIWAYSNQGPDHERAVLRQISKYKVGGILFFQGEPREQVRLTNRYQEASEVPLLIAMDGENGPGMRLRNTMTYPSMMSLGAISDNRLIYTMGQDIAAQFRRLGVQMNFAPVADINNNPFNPVIGTRSFGEQRENVAEKVVAYMQGMQEERLLVAAKHFPGHGDTGGDSHHSLPVIPYGMDRLDSLELFPFRYAIEHGLTGMMVAHLQVPALDSREKRPTTLSRSAITGLLRERMGFTGLIITDALNMKGISEYYAAGEREVEAVKAGNDILLMP
ncbi:MAG: glycoside hydrolase family 3 protein, partial [Bacteroidales bacterium]